MKKHTLFFFFGLSVVFLLAASGVRFIGYPGVSSDGSSGIAVEGNVTADGNISGADGTFTGDVTMGRSYSNLSNTIVLIGDSITDSCEKTIVSGTNERWLAAGYWNYAQAFLGYRFRVLNIAGVGGEKYADLVDRLDTDVIPYGPKFCLIQDLNSIIGGSTYALIIGYIETISDRLKANATTPIFLSPMPATGIDSADENLIWHQVDWWMRQNADIEGFIYIDVASSYIDFDATYANPLSGYTSDGTHPNSTGAYVIGKAIADTLDNIITSNTGYHIQSESDPTLASVNGAMDGTGGTAGDNASGDIADGWTLAGITSDCAVVGSKAARAKYGEWQVLTLTPAADHTYARLRQPNIAYTEVGDTIYAQAEIKIGSVVPEGIYVELSATDASYATLMNVQGPWLNQNNDQTASWVENDTFVLRTPNMTVPATTAKANINIYVFSSTGTNAVVSIGSAGIVTVQE